MAILKLNRGLGEDLPTYKLYGGGPTIRGKLNEDQAGNCCGAVIISGFSTSPDISEKHRDALLDKMLTHLGKKHGDMCLNEEDEDEGEDEYDEDEDTYIMSYPKTIETTPMMASIITAYLANKQIPLWHSVLIRAGFRMMVEGGTNSKSMGGLLNMYVGEMPGSPVYAQICGNPKSRMHRGLRRTQFDADKHQKEPG